MKEEPVISAGAIKAVLALLLIAGIGVGTWALLDGRLDDIDLPELPEIQTTTEPTTPETTLEETTTDGGGELPQPAQEAREQARCIAEAQDSEAILDCLER